MSLSILRNKCEKVKRIIIFILVIIFSSCTKKIYTELDVGLTFSALSKWQQYESFDFKSLVPGTNDLIHEKMDCAITNRYDCVEFFTNYDDHGKKTIEVNIDLEIDNVWAVNEEISPSFDLKIEAFQEENYVNLKMNVLLWSFDEINSKLKIQAEGWF